MKEQDAAHSFEKTNPDFPQWIETEAGKGCLRWPISEVKYLRNRLFWAFDAGRNCVWDQSMNQKSELTSLRSELQQAKQEIANHIAVNSLLTDSDDEAYLANKLYKATSELQQERELRKELVKGMEWAASQMAVNVPSTQSSLYARWVGCRENLESLIKKAKL